MVILLMAGIGLLLFGGIVLLRYPHKPGGKIAIGSLEVSSVGAGLPLIVLGVACILAYARTEQPNLWLPGASTEAPAPSTSTGCFDRYFSDFPPDRKSTVEVGTSDKTVLSASQTKTAPIALLFNENRETFGGITFNVFASDNLFKVDAIIDANCQPIEQYANVSRGGDKNVFQNWDTLQMTMNNQSYMLTLGYSEGEVEVNAFGAFTP